MCVNSILLSTYLFLTSVDDGLFAGCLILGKLCNSSVPWISHLYNDNKDCPFIIKLL